MSARSQRFAEELSTANRIQTTVLHAKGVSIDVVKAHEIWADHSNDYCATWLCVDSADPTGEILRALAKYEDRYGPLPRVPLPLVSFDFSSSTNQPK
jgi:hypothetical protein